MRHAGSASWHAGSFSCSMQTQLRHVDLLVAACKLLVAACVQNLAPRPGIEPRPPALGAPSFTHWTTREVALGHFLLLDNRSVQITLGKCSCRLQDKECISQLSKRCMMWFLLLLLFSLISRCLYISSHKPFLEVCREKCMNK